mgnify:CR=1 FL=1
MGASNNTQPIQSQTAPPAAIAPSGGGGCGHGGGQAAPPPVSQPPMAQASQPPQQGGMPSWFTGNGGATPPAIQPGIRGAVNGGALPMQAAVLNHEPTVSQQDASRSSLFQTLPGPTGGRPMGPPGQGGASIGQGLNLQSLPWAGGMMMGPDGQAKAGVMEGGQVMPQTLFSM